MAMPELPEVETVMRGLKPVLEGRRISHVALRRKDLRFPFPAEFAARLTGKRILSLSRRAKYILGSVEGGVDVFDRFSFTLAPGEQLDSVILNGFVGDSNNTVRFFTGTDTGAPPPAFLGETFMSTARIGSDYLDLVGLGLFGPGVYTISIVGGPGLHSYDFILSVPEPGPAGAALGLVVGLGTLCSLRRARAASARRAPTSAPARRAPAPPGRP